MAMRDEIGNATYRPSYFARVTSADTEPFIMRYDCGLGGERGEAETTLSLGKVVPMCSGLRTKRARVAETLLLVDISMSE